ncbi:MAG: hypothetical protein HN509_16450, partial [Halobacteriovoraceae bacterium]|nr:hypothetical protein [Halobacteriovoraceae bacterium]
YLILGTQLTYQTDSGVTMGAAQDIIHQVTGSSDYTNTERGISEFWINGIFGVGRELSLHKGKYFKVSLMGEVTLNPSSRFRDESHVAVNTRLGVGIGRYRATGNPVAQLNLLFDNAFYLDGGRRDYHVGVELGFPIRISKKGWYITPTLNYHYYHTNEDADYNGSVGEYVAGIYFTVTKKRPVKVQSFIFND